MRLLNKSVSRDDSRKLISLSKSKEYAKLASQIPTILQIKDGQRYINESVIEKIGFKGGQTDAYRNSLKQLRVHEDHVRQRKLEMMMVGVGQQQAVNASTNNLDLGEGYR